MWNRIERRRVLVGSWIGAAVVVATLSTTASAQVYQTNPPFGSPFGLIGYDVFHLQSVGVRFTPDRMYYFTGANFWVMSNDFAGPSNAEVRVSLRGDDPTGGESRPSNDIIYETMTFRVSAIGWDPVEERVSSRENPPLRPGEHYWLVMMCDVTGDNPVWNWAHPGNGFMSNTDGDQTTWQPGGFGAVVSVTIRGNGCYADCDTEGHATLDIFDFLCFGNRFANGDSYACDCDITSGIGVCDIFDFLCFGNAFTAGCP